MTAYTFQVAHIYTYMYSVSINNSTTTRINVYYINQTVRICIYLPMHRLAAN